MFKAFVLVAMMALTSAMSLVPEPQCMKECPKGEICVLQTVYCITYPCPDPTEACVPIKKPGTCPAEKLGLITTCDVRCSSDASCPGDQKCCNFGCSIRCMNPREKPGTCPNKLDLGFCYSACDTDDDCAGDRKCCGGCLRFCRAPIHPTPEPKLPMGCPLVSPSVFGICVVKCTEDSCPKGQLCCGSCPRKCKVAVAVKPGACRKPSRVCKKSEPNGCTKDTDCKSDDKCCNTGCSLQCINPVYSL